MNGSTYERPGPFWPAHKDGIDDRMADDASPLEKYAKAFNAPPSIHYAVSRSSGIDAYNQRQPCSFNEHCIDLNDDSVCAIRRGRTEGFCIPMWFGMVSSYKPIDQ